MSLQHIQKNSPRLLHTPGKFEKNPPNGYRVIRKMKRGAGGAWFSPIHKKASLAGRFIISSTLKVCLRARKCLHVVRNKSRLSSLLVLQGSEAFCFLTYLRLCLILICCSSEKFVQILHGDWFVTQGSSPLPDTLHVGKKLWVSNRKQKCRHLDDLGFALVWWEDIFTSIKSKSKRGKLTNNKYSKNTYPALFKLCQNDLCNKNKQMAE